MSSPRKKSDLNLSADQFQEKLHSWLKDQGLLSELKSHLRMQMVSALQDGSPSINRQFSVSPKIQALTVLIADFLLQQGHSFSLSVLTTEVPFVGQMFSHLSQSSTKAALESGRLLSERFSARDVEDILETLGVPPGSKMHAEVLNLYNDSTNSDSLLICIIRCLSFLNFEKSRVNETNAIFNPDHDEERDQGDASPDSIRNCCEHHAAESPESWVQEMHRALAQNNITLCQIDELQNRMKKIHEAEISRVREEEAAKYSGLIEEKLKRQEEREKFFGEWQEKVREEIEKKEEKLRLFANELISQHNDIKNKLSKLEEETEIMKKQEKALKEKMDRSVKELEAKKSEMELEKADIEDAYERLLLFRKKELEEQRADEEREEKATKKKDATTQLEGLNLIKWLQDQCSGLLHVGANTQNEVEKEDKGLQTVLPTVENRKIMDSDHVEREDDEKAELKERIIRQRRRIDELTTRAADLANQLQDAHAAAQLIQPHHLASITTPPIIAPATVRIHPRPVWPPHIGSGEETSFSNRLPHSISRSTQASRMTGNAPLVSATNTSTFPENDLNNASGTGSYSRRRARRMPARTAAATTNNSSDDSTTTEEMIEEARQRLRRLENESLEIHQTYQDFRLRLAQEIPPAILHPEQDRSRNPFNYQHFSTAGQNIITCGRNMLARTNPRTCTVKLDSVLNMRPTYDMFQPGYRQFQNVIIGNGGRHLSAVRRRSMDDVDDDRISKTDEYLENVNHQSSALQSFVRSNRSRPTDFNSLRKKMTERRFSNGLEDAATVTEKPDCEKSFESTEEEKGSSRLESEVINESLRKHEILRSEIDEKLSKRKEFLKKTVSGKDCEKKQTKSLTFNKTVTVLENNNETWYATRSNLSEDDNSSDRMMIELNAVPEQHRLVDNEHQSVSGNSNCSYVASRISDEGVRRGLKSSSAYLERRILDEDARIVNVDNVPLDTKWMKSSALVLSEKNRDVSNSGDTEEGENLNPSDFHRNNGIIEESQSIKNVSDNDGSLVFDGDSFGEEKRSIRQNGHGSSHPRTRSPSSLVSHVTYGSNGPLSPSNNLECLPGYGTDRNQRTPEKMNLSEINDRVPSFLLSLHRNGTNSITNQNESCGPRTLGEPDMVDLREEFDKMTMDSVGGGEDTAESAKIKKNGVNTCAAHVVKNRMAMSSSRTATESSGDPWREPGDGTDYEKIDSDDPVSVGTQESSSASFW